MRLTILDRGHGVATKALFALIRVGSRHPVLDVIKLVKYRPEFYGTPMQRVTQEAMRGRSPWSVADRELMAAFVAQSNQCTWCRYAHTAVATAAYDDGARVKAALADPETAEIAEPLRATLHMLAKLTRERTLEVDDIHAVVAAGATREQIADAFAVSFAFNVIGRLADAFGFTVATPEAYQAGAKYLLARGYR
jgi:AhpD family alkylhydroperoxidase